MFKKALPFFIRVITPLHAGTGQELGVVDLPIQRERHTGFPKVEASGLKGSIREVFEEQDKEIQVGEKKIKVNDKDAISLIFGPDKEVSYAGALGFTDARILLFPIKSMKGVYAYITCRKVLRRFKEEIEITNRNVPFEIAETNADTLIGSGDAEVLVTESKIILEEYTFDAKVDESIKSIGEWLGQRIGINDLAQRIVVLPDDDFKDFVHLSTEVTTRIKINNETGTVQEGALFTEEYLPAETILYSLALASPIFKEKDEEKGIFKQNGKAEEDLVIEFFKRGMPEVMQLGGNATIGKGIVKIKLWED